MKACPVIGVRDLTVHRGHRALFETVTFDLPPGRALLLQGTNGSGKSTLLRALLGMVPSESGSIELDGEARPPSARALCAHALYCGHAPGIKGEWTALENLRSLAELDVLDTPCVTAGHRPSTADAAGPASIHDPAAAALARCGLAHRHIEARRLSQGQRQRIALARLALHLQAPMQRWLWLLDEPTAALDAAGDALFVTLLGEHLARGGSAIVATHLPIALPPEQTIAMRLTAPSTARSPSSYLQARASTGQAPHG